MDRRDFLKFSLATMAGHAVSSNALRLSSAAAAPDWTLGWQGIDVDHLKTMPLQVEGRIPEAVYGSLYRNGPARIERAGRRYRHWFDGDGMIQHFRIDANGVGHEGRFIQTAKYQEEQAARRFLYGGAGTAFEDERPSRNNDTGNVANTSLLPWNDELLALWEGGSAYRVDPDDLSTLGRKDWRDDLKHMPFSAHPLLEEDGTMWNIGAAPYAGQNGIVFVYRIAADGTVTATAPIATPMRSYMHSFAMSERYLLFYLAPHRFEAGETFVDSFQWRPELGSTIMLVDKNDLSSQQIFEVPAGFTFHFAQAFERGHEVVARLALYDDASIMSDGMIKLLSDDTGGDYPEFARAHLASLRMDTRSGKAIVESTDTLIEFPGIDLRSRNESTPVFGVGHAAGDARTYSDAVVLADADTGKTRRYEFPEHHIVEEPLFVTDRQRKHGGWLVGTFLDFDSEQTGVYVLDALALEAGPVAIARMDRHVPLGFHGCFVARG